MSLVDRRANYLIEASDLTVAKRLHGVDLRWHRGELIGLLGANGSGKSTLLGALAGILPVKGQLRLNGEAISRFSWPQLAQIRAMLPQRQPQLLHIRVFQVLGIGLTLTEQAHQVNEVVMQITQALELDELLNREFSHLSGGEQQRVLIARTLLQVWPSLNPHGQLLLLDEPLAGLDLHHQVALLQLLKSATAQGLLVVLSIHDINVTIEWTSRILCLAKGRVVKEGSADIIDSALLKQVFKIKTERIVAGDRVWFMPVSSAP